MGSIDYKDDKGWDKLDKDSSVFVKLSKKHNKGESNAWGKATTTIDTSAENVLAWIWDYCSNERLNATKKLHKNPREVIKHSAPNQNVFSSIKSLPWPLRSRQFVSENTWTKQDDKMYVYAWRPPITHEFDDNHLVDIGNHKVNKLVRAESKGFCTLTNVGNQKCELTWVQHLNLNGNIPAKLMDKQIPRSLGAVFQVRETFNRDDEIDREERNEIMGVMKNDENEVYSEEESAFVRRVTLRMDNIAEGIITELKTPDFRVPMSLSHVDGEPHAFFKCKVLIDATIEECCAYNFQFNSRKRMRINDRKDVLLREEKSVNNHNKEFLMFRAFPLGISPRSFMSRQIWQLSATGERIDHNIETIKKSDLLTAERKNLAR